MTFAQPDIVLLKRAIHGFAQLTDFCHESAFTFDSVVPKGLQLAVWLGARRVSSGSRRALRLPFPAEIRADVGASLAAGLADE
jgi:hypothetical protein